ncbi:MAG: hypothetical protein WBE69_15895 [Candidatus Binataceae bacterium]
MALAIEIVAAHNLGRLVEALVVHDDRTQQSLFGLYCLRWRPGIDAHWAAFICAM